ncbi:MAG: hypothetical protein M1608_02605 [Candidatus Omnitrophica bacterium]|nr:hypothetical protein [Candidatus Omnitrophota bacterium]
MSETNMDITFMCPNCRQEMVVDSADAGRDVDCPACGSTITIPEADPANVRQLNPIASSAAAKEDRHYSVPVHEAPSEVLIQKPNPPLDAAAKEGEKKLRIKSIRRVDCMEVGHDLFDQKVTEFLEHIGEGNLVNISTLSYTHMDMATRQLITDYGVMIVYKG